MRITPLDVRKQEFRKAVRGFDCDEVRAFLTTLADEYETVLVDSKQIRERLMDQEGKLAEYTKMERNLRDTLMTAERVMQETKESASQKGELLVTDAKMKARNILEECRMRTEELRREIVALRKEKESYLARFRSLAESQIQFINTHESDFEDLDKRLIELVDSVMDHDGEPETKAAPKPMPTPSRNERKQPISIPASEPAPVVGGAADDSDDVWRNYNPGTPGSAGSSEPTPGIAQEPPPPFAPAADQMAAITPASAPPVDQPRNDEPAETDLNHLLSETLTEIPAESPTAADPTTFAAPDFVPAAVNPNAPSASAGPTRAEPKSPMSSPFSAVDVLPSLPEPPQSAGADGAPATTLDPFASVMAASVEMASLGIPVPAVPITGPVRDQGQSLETDPEPLEVVNTFHT